MGWDEGRLKNVSDALRREAQDLGEMLRKMDEEEGLRRLIMEAEAALGHGPAAEYSAPTPDESIPQAQPPSDEGSRDRQMIEATRPEEVVPLPVLALTGGSNAAPATARDDGEVIDIAVGAPGSEHEEDWRETVQRGDRRLV